MRATELLEQQHRDAEKLLKRVSSGECDVAQAMDELGTHLMNHMLLEEVVLLPEVLPPDDVESSRMLDEQVLERCELRRILSTDAHDSGPLATMVALKEIVEHHIKEAEHALLSKAEAILPDETNERLGERMAKLFCVLVARSHRGERTRPLFGEELHRRAAPGSDWAEPSVVGFGAASRR